MKYKLILAGVLLVGCVSTVSAELWSLDSCINYALAKNINIQRQRLQAEQGELAVREARDKVLPNVNGYASESFNFGRGLTSDNTYANRNTSSFSVGAQMSVPLFQGLRVVRTIKYERTSLRALVERTKAACNDVRVNVMAQYLQALYARESLEIARMSLSISQRELERRKVLLEAGKIPELDIYEAQAQVSRDELTVVNAKNDSVLALLDLANLINLPNDTGFDIAALNDNAMPLPALADVWGNASVRDHSLKAGEIQKEAAAQNVDVARSGYIPTLSFNAGLGTNYYKTSGFINEGFKAQMRHNFAKTLGFSLNIPIFDGFNTRNSISRAKMQETSAALELEETRLNLYKTITTAHTQAVAAERKEQSASVSVASAKAAFEAMQVKYDNGKANATEYEKAKSDYTNALSEQLQARYERMLRARILRHYLEM